MSDEQTFRLMFEGHSSVMLLIEPETGIILDANQSAVDFYGYPRSTLCGMAINKINILSSAQVAAEHQKALDEGRNYFIFPHKVASGKECLVEEISSQIVLQDKPLLLSIIHDITERKYAESVSEIEQYFVDALMDNVPAYIYFKDRESRFIRVNNAHARALGLSDAGQVVGKTDFDFFTDEHAQQAYRDEQFIIETGKSVSKEEKETRHGLPDTWVSTTKLPLCNDDKNIIGTLGISVDITERKRAESNLEERLAVEQNLLSALLDNLPDVIYVKDRQGRKIISNIADWQSSGGKTIDDVLGKSDFDTYPPELAARFWVDDKSVLDTGVSIINQEEPGLDHLGNSRWVLTTKVPLRDANGQITGLIGIGRDITERKQAEDALLKSEKRFRSLIEESPLAISLSRNGLGLYMNPRFLEMFRLSSGQEMRGHPVFEFFAPEHQEASKERARRRELGLPVPTDFESVGIRADGSEFPIHLVSTQLQLADGPVNLSFITDITERKQAEDQLRQLSRAVEFCPVSIIVTDKNGKIEYANPKFSAVSGYSFVEVRGKNPSILKSDKTPPEVYAELWQIILSGKEWHGELLNRRKDGELYWDYASISAIIDANGSITHFVAVNEDITARKDAEEKIRLLNVELEQLSHTDALTGINNRGYLFELTRREFNIAIRYQQPLSLMFFDIDHFKQINDTFGHAMGDQVLKQLTQIVCDEIRSVDVIGRYGGDEFFVLLPQTSAQEVRPLAERIHADVAALQIETNKGTLKLTISVGIAQTNHGSVPEFGHTSLSETQSDTVENLFLRADRALYIAKRNGRNRTVIFDADETGAVG